MTERSDTSPELDKCSQSFLKPIVIDTSRQGGEDTAPKRILGHEPMSVADAEEHVERMLGWRTVLGASNQATLALLREVRRLRVVVSELEAGYQNSMELSLTCHGQRDRANEELARFRAALLGTIGCVMGNVATCRTDTLWRKCCFLRRDAETAGWLPAAERVMEVENGV